MYKESLVCIRLCYCLKEDWQSDFDEDSLRVDLDEGTEAFELRHALYLNIALASLKLKKWSEAVKACECAIDIKPTVKAFYRKATALSSDPTQDFID